MRKVAELWKIDLDWESQLLATSSLTPVMLFDPATQIIDEPTRAIGEEVCSLFCAHDDTDRIHEVLAQAQS